jgi:hypothetical protein
MLSATPRGPESNIADYVSPGFTALFIAPHLASDAKGNYIVAWADIRDGDGLGILAQRYDVAGNAVGSVLSVNQFTTGGQYNPDVAMDANGDFVVSWVSYGGTPTNVDAHIDARRYDALGRPLGDAFHVNTTPITAHSPAVAMAPDGSFVVTWVSGDVRARRFDAAGNPIGAELQVGPTVTGVDCFPDVATRNGGDFVVAYETGGPTIGGGLVHPNGSSTGFSAAAPAGVTQVARPAVAMDPAGDFVVTFDAPYGGNIYARRFAAVAQSDTFLVNTYTTGRHYAPSVATDADGNFLIAWSGDGNSGKGIYLQTYSKTSQLDGNSNLYVGASQVSADPDVAMDSAGHVVCAWLGDAPPGGTQLHRGRQRLYSWNLSIPHLLGSSFVHSSKPQQVRFVFSEDVSSTLAPDDLILHNVTAGTAAPASDLGLAGYDSITNSATFEYLGNGGLLADGNYQATLLAAGVRDTSDGGGNALDGNADGTGGDDYVTNFFFLNGDANHDRTVDVTDLGILATNWQSTGVGFSQGDFNLDGFTDVTDLGILATNWQKSLPAVSGPVNAASAQPALRSSRSATLLEELT